MPFDAKRVLFLVDTKNLGEQAEQKFMGYTPNDDNRNFTELYNVQRLKSSFVAKDIFSKQPVLATEQASDEVGCEPVQFVKPMVRFF